jgi:phosphate transport system permease protein
MSTSPSEETRPSADGLAGVAVLPPPPPLTASDIVGGRLPGWGTWAVYGVAALLVVAVAAATSLNLLLLIIAAIVGAGAVVYAWSLAVEGGRKARDRTVTLVVTSSFAIAVAPLVSLLWTVVDRGAARFDAQFFTESARNVVGAGGGAYHAIVGTLVITAVTTIASVPIGVMAAVYLQEYGTGRLKSALVFFVDVMTGIPSIVAGLFAYALFALFLGPGVRLGIVGAVALSVLMIPIVVRSTEEMLKIVPNGLREASYALGVPKWRTILKVVLPTALPGIVTGVMVAVARVMGETAPLLITTGTFSTVNWNPFAGRMENLPVFTFSQYRNPGVPKEPYIDRAWAAALTLIVIVMLLNIIAGFVSRRSRKEAP